MILLFIWFCIVNLGTVNSGMTEVIPRCLCVVNVHLISFRFRHRWVNMLKCLNRHNPAQLPTLGTFFYYLKNRAYVFCAIDFVSFFVKVQATPMVAVVVARCRVVQCRATCPICHARLVARSITFRAILIRWEASLFFSLDVGKHKKSKNWIRLV